jgi:hypothetical protein
MRRLSTLVALFALIRVSLSGTAAGCTPVSAEVEQHRHSSPTAITAAHDHDAAGMNGGDTDCGNAQHGSCLSMSSCASAVLSNACVQRSETAAAQRIVVGVSARAFELPRGPEPPPPRA